MPGGNPINQVQVASWTAVSFGGGRSSRIKPYKGRDERNRTDLQQSDVEQMRSVHPRIVCAM